MFLKYRYGVALLLIYIITYLFGFLKRQQICLLLVSQNEIREENDLEKMKKMQYISLSFNRSKDVPC